MVPLGMGRAGGVFSLLFILSSALLLLSSAQTGERTAYAQAANVEVTVDAEPRMSSIVVDGVIYMPSQLPATFSWEDGSTHTIGIPSASTLEGNAKRYDFVQWNDQSQSLTRSIKVTDDMPLNHFIALFQTKYLLTIYSDHGSPSGAGWYDEGSPAELNMTANELFVETIPGKARVAFTGWSTGYMPTSPRNYVDMSGPTVVIANWKDQYRLDVISAIAPASGKGWYDSGAIARIGVPGTVELADEGRKYTFKEWQVIGDGSQAISDKTHESAEVVMDGPHTIAPLWNEMYLVRIDSNTGNPSGEGYYHQGETASITIDPIYETEVGKSRFVLSGWEGVQLDDPSSSTSSIPVQEPLVLKPLWTKQFFVKANSVYGLVAGSGWYDEGSTATLSLQSRTLDTGLGKIAGFAGWSTGDPQSITFSQSDQYTIESVGGPEEITAVWRSDDTVQLVLIVGAVAAAVIVAFFTFMINVRKRKSVQQAKGVSYGRGVGV
jgi:hypothetical protein